MSTLVYRESPREIGIRPPKNITNVCVLLKLSQSNSVDVSFPSSDALTGFHLLSQRQIYGCIGIVMVKHEPFVGVITEAVKTTELEGQPIFSVLKCSFYSLLNGRHDNELQSIENDQLQHPCSGLMKLLSTGSFYFSPSFDLTKELRLRKSQKYEFLIDSGNPDYIWNKNIMQELMRVKNEEAMPQIRADINNSGVFVLLVQGFVGSETVSVGAGGKWKLVVISRLSSNRAGTRFNARGIDDDGNVSNFVETEFILYTSHACVCFIQLRGSIPLFWEQTGVQVGGHKVKLSRGPESSIHATKKHFQELVKTYSNIQVVNLLNLSPASPEYVLTEAYRESVKALPELGRSLRYHEFDFAAIIQRDRYERLDELGASMREVLLDFSFNVYDASLDVVIQRQYGVIRTNCLDCLDRTNVVQTFFAKLFLRNWITQIGFEMTSYDQEAMDNSFNNLWADNGDWLSKIYAGTGALKSSYTRNGKQTMFGFIDDAAKSLNRMYINNFQDKGRQEAIDLLLSASPIINSGDNAEHEIALREQITEYSSFSELIVFCGTYNLNGRTPQGEDLRSWLMGRSSLSADLAVIGVQELIKLTPGEYITADTDRLRLIWEGALLKNLNIQNTDFVVLRSLHLVALGLFVFIKRDLTSRLRDVEISSIKTGLMGMAANKGGIGIRLRLDDSSLAFVTAHFAAGQSNVEDRNNDYRTISEGLNFRGVKLRETDNIFWFGDFNYRLDTDNTTARGKIQSRELHHLWQYDQLRKQIQKNLAFLGFEEGDLNFDPTYKYDNNSVVYDTSEKQRVPSWTDRVIFTGRFIKLLEYGRGEQVMSDHRPVKAIFSVKIALHDKDAKIRLNNNLRKKNSAGSKTSAILPPPSSDEDKWWENPPRMDLPMTKGPNPFFDFPTSEPKVKGHELINLMD